MNSILFFSLIFLSIILLSYPVYALSFQDVTNFFGSFFNSIASFFNSAFSVLLPKPASSGGGGGGGGGGPSGPPSCSVSLSLSSAGKDTCTITATVMTSYCDNKTYEIKNVACTGTISGNSFTKSCTWSVTSGSYTYDLYVDGQYKLSKTVTCSKSPPPACSDGTLYGSCSSTKPKYCSSGTLINSCSQCGCPTSQSCNTTTNTCYTPVLVCSDNTPYSQCSATKPKYCSSGTLINKCSQCGCPSSQSCNSTTNACYIPVTPTCDSNCKSQSYASGICRTGSSTSLLPAPTQFTLIANPRDSSSNNYHTHNDLLTMFKTLFDKYPGYASYEPVGKSYEGRDIVLFKIGNPNGGAVLWDGAMHGWEDAGSEIEYLIAKWLLENGTTGIDPTAQKIIQQNLILFVPVVNMDSYERQDRDFTSCSYGVDLNRNFVKGWTAAACGNMNYPGPSGASEKETQTLKSVFQTYKPKFYVNVHYGGGPILYYYTGTPSNITLSNSILTRINQLSSQTGVTTYPTGQVGASGQAVGDASDYASAWILEVAGDRTGCSCYSHTCDTYSDIVNTYYPKVLPIFLAMTEASAVATASTPACQSGETPIGQDGCSSGVCCCSGTTPPAQLQITIDSSKVIGINNFSIGFMTDWSWPGFVSDNSRRQLVKDANFKLVRVFDFRTTSPKIMPCSNWDTTKDNCTSWDWTQVDSFTQAVFEIGAEPMFTLSYARNNIQNYIPPGMPVNVSTGNSTLALPNSNSYAVYASEWVKHFKQKGWPVRYYEIGNEPSAYFGWNPSNNLKLTYYVDFWNTVARAMRQQNPNILLSQDALTQTNVFNYWLLHGDDVDYLDFHKYDCGVWDKSDPAYYSDSKLFGLAESSRFETSSSTYGVKDSQQKWLASRGKLLPVIDSESNLNSAWEGGTDPRNQQMTGAVWTAMNLRMGILKGLEYNVYYEFSSNGNTEDQKASGGYGFGMIDSYNDRSWYPYYVQKWIGNNLGLGDNLVQSASSSNNIRTLSWIDNEKLNLFIIHNSTKSETVSLQGVTGQFNYWKIDDPSGISYLNAQVQTGTIDAASVITINGYTVMLLQKS